MVLQPQQRRELLAVELLHAGTVGEDVCKNVADLAEVVQKYRNAQSKSEAAVKKLKDTGVKVLGAVLTRYDAKTALKGSNYAYNYYSYGYSYGTPQTDPAASQSPEKRKHAKPAERVTNHD